MKNKGQIIFFVVLGIIVLGIYAMIRNRGYMWKEDYPQYAYHDKCEEPFGLSVLYKLSQEVYKSAEVVRIEKSIEQELPLEAAPNASYLMISHSTFFTSKERQHLQKWVENGGIVLISAKTIDWNIFKKVTALDTLLEENPLEFGGEVIEEGELSDSLQEAAMAIPEEKEDEAIAELEEVEEYNADSIAMASNAYEDPRLVRFDTFAQFTLVQPLGNLSGKHFTFTFPQQNVANRIIGVDYQPFFLILCKIFVLNRLDISKILS